MASKILVRSFLILVVLPLALFTGCKKKERLSASTSVLAINPPSATLLKGETVTLTSQRTHPNGSPTLLSSDWTVSGTGTCDDSTNLSLSFGETVVFTAPNELCDATVTAAYENETAVSHLSIVTYKPSATTYNVYNDNGLPPGVLAIDQNALTITELNTGYTPEGNKYLHLSPTGAGSYFFIELPSAVNLSAFATGKLKFSIRLASSAGVSWQVKVKDTTDRIVTLSGAHNFSNLVTGSWQEVSIDIADFAGLATSAVTIPFLIVESGTAEYDVDAIRWEPN